MAVKKVESGYIKANVDFLVIETRTKLMIINKYQEPIFAKETICQP